MTALSAIEGIGATYQKKLKEAGVGSIEALLNAGAKTRGRKDLAASTGISDKLILEWINRADLFRIKGIGEEYSDLLEQAGVDTVPELAQRSAESLYKKMAEINEKKNIVRKLPSESQVADWIKAAKSLPRVVEY